MKNIILWNHKRGTWQYDVFCLLIIAFIFLTPKSWFAGKERDTTPQARIRVKANDSTLAKSERDFQFEEQSNKK